MIKRPAFDTSKFHAALERARVKAKLSLGALERETGVGKSTLSRLGQGREPSAASLAALCRWGKLDATKFLMK